MDPIDEKIREYRLKLFGHIHRKAFNAIVRTGLTQVEDMKKLKEIQK